MLLNTMSAVMTFVTRIENDSADFFEAAAEKFPEIKAELTARAKENRKFAKQVKQTYFGIITDTLESNYCFEGLDSDHYPLDVELSDSADIDEIKEKAGKIEDTISEFYTTAAGMSEGLMADIPRLFKKIAQKREKRAF